MIVPTLSALARLGWLRSMSARFNAKHWEALGRVAEYEVRGAALPEGMEPHAAAGRAVRQAWQVLNKSPILGAVISAALRAMPADARRAVAVLAIVDVDPWLLRRTTAGSLINLVADAISSPRARAESDFNEADVDAVPGVEAAATSASETAHASDQVDDQSLRRPRRARTSNDQALDPTSAPHERPQLSARSSNESPKRFADESWFQQFADEETAPPDLRQRAISRFAGLLYLISIIQDLDLPEQIATDRILGPRPLGWVFHQLALLLAPVEARDPAALAFAGLSPEAEFPWADEASANEAETQALGAFADQIVTRLASLFDDEELTEVSPLEFVTRRRGEIVADPGWIEVRFSLDDVTTEIRRAGLDLNPGYVPWLGVVVMFAYE
jgi:hypothetical protein